MKRVNGCGNTRQQYGWLAVGLHGLSALLLVSLFALGFWMVELSYYDYWYKLAPFYHKSVGILFFFLVLLRWLVRAWGETVDPAVSLSRWERVASTWGHRILYVGMVLVPVLGYGISTADGRGVAV
ncbi:MAG: cytochrome b/b6 domain-containing protein, partial [Gammaproteobacteria bacterium]